MTRPFVTSQESAGQRYGICGQADVKRPGRDQATRPAVLARLRNQATVPFRRAVDFPVHHRRRHSSLQKCGLLGVLPVLRTPLE